MKQIHHKLLTEVSEKSSGGIIENKEDLKQLLLKLTEEKVDSQFSDYSLDRANEIIKLRNGSEITLAQINEQHRNVTSQLQEYMVTFPMEFYREIYRLHGWVITDESLRMRPSVIAKYTIEIIYLRFSKEVLPFLQVMNPMTSFGVRKHKHFQFLTPEGREKLQQFISEGITVMKKCSEWYEFRVRLHAEFGVPFQRDLFKDAVRTEI